MSTSFGEYIRASREALKKHDPRFSVRQLAARIGVKPSYLSRVERGEAAALTEAKTVALAGELSINPDVLLALSGKISSDVQEVIRQRPELFAELVRDLKDLPDRAVLADKEYRLAESRLNEAQRIARIGSWERVLEGKDFTDAVRNTDARIYRSDELFRIFGTFNGDPRVHPVYLIENLVAPEDREYVRHEYYERFPITGSLDIRFRFRTLAGKYRYAHVHGAMECDKNGSPVKIRGTFQDVTGEHETKTELRRSEERYRAIVEAQTEAISRLKADGTFIFVNDEYCRFFGKRRGELIGKKWQPIAVSDDIPRIERRLAELSPENPVVVLENRVYSATGDIRCMQFVNRAFFDDYGELLEIQSVGRDITDRKTAENSLEESEQYHRMIFDTVDDMVLVFELDGRLLDVNRAVCRRLGYSMDDLARMNKKDLLAPEQALEYGRRIEELVTSGRLYFESEYVSREQRIIPVEVSSRVMWRHGRRLVISVARDISRRRRYERDRSTLVAALEQSAECIIVTDAAGRIVYVNPAFGKITGYTGEEVLARHMNILSDGSAVMDRDSILESLRQGGVWSGKLRNRRKDGGEVEVEASISPVRDEQGRIMNFVAVEREVCDEPKVGRKSSRDGKERVTAALAEGIAEDLNNSLLPIIVNVEMAKEKVRDDSALLARLTDALASAGRARELVRSILDVGTDDSGNGRSRDLAVAVEEILSMIGGSIPGNITLKRRFRTGLREVDAAPMDLRRLVFAILSNAIRAIESDGGDMLLRIESCELDRTEELPQPPMKLGRYVVFSVITGGKGIGNRSKNQEARLPDGDRKSGSAAWPDISGARKDAISQGGALTVEDKAGQGTAVTLFLPAASGKKRGKEEDQGNEFCFDHYGRDLGGN